MAEGTYEYECMRAELLGVEAPDREEFEAQQRARAKEEEEAIAILKENVEKIVETDVELKTTTGKFEELNNILAATQKKIDRFKFRCGSVTELIKTKISGIAGENGGAATPPNSQEQLDQPEPEAQSLPQEQEPAAMKSDLTKALDKQTDALDSLLDRAENASISMTEQTKQMKRFLR